MALRRLMTAVRYGGTLAMAVTAAVVVSGCEPRKPPAEDVVDAKPLKEQGLPGQPAPTTFRRTVVDLRAAEPAALKAYPALATRSGTTLKAFVGGKPAFSGTDSDCSKIEAEECEAYVFAGPLPLLAASGKIEAYPLIQHSYIESAIFHVPLGNGDTFDINAQAMASPDGKLIAAGSDSVDEMNGDSALTLYDWPTKRTVARFDPSCQPNAWTSNTAFSVLCMIHENGIHVFEGVVSKGMTGTWTLKVTRALDPVSYQPLPPDKQVSTTYAAHTSSTGLASD